MANFSGVGDTTRLFSNKLEKIVLGDWQLSPIVRLQTGTFSSLTTGQDNALTGIANQRPVQVLANPYAVTRTATQWLNKAAFANPATGTLSNLAPFSIENPGSIQVDAAISRYFPVHDRQRVQFRWEVFNVPNHNNPSAPLLNLSNGTFGQIQGPSQIGPRIMQFALKYEF